MRRFLPLVFLIVPFMLAQQDAPPQKKGRPAPKNLKILPADANLIPTMHSYTIALGVQCTFCHVQGDFASDENPKKEMARHMIQLAHDINAKFPDGKEHVTCYTCHHGANVPLTSPPAAPAPGGQQ
jgi:hypothetical protein